MDPISLLAGLATGALGNEVSKRFVSPALDSFLERHTSTGQMSLVLQRHLGFSIRDAREISSMLNSGDKEQREKALAVVSKRVLSLPRVNNFVSGLISYIGKGVKERLKPDEPEPSPPNDPHPKPPTITLGNRSLKATSLKIFGGDDE